MEQQYNQTTDIFLDEPVVYAGFWIRFIAAFIDGIILLIPNLIFTYLMPEVAGTILSLLAGWLYYATMESSSGQATLGKKAVGIKVTSVEGGAITFGQATGRHFGKIISTIIIFIGYLMMLWDSKSQTLHDKMADALVVKA